MKSGRIRHGTPAGGNIFLDLGFAPAEAARLQVPLRAGKTFLQP
jgi:hypothetical protein